MWNPDDLSIDLDDDVTDHPILTLIVITPVGDLRIMVEPAWLDQTLVLRGLDIQGVSANVVGWAKLRVLADVIMKEIRVDEIIVEGAVRTTGATPGRTPQPIRFTRRS